MNDIPGFSVVEGGAANKLLKRLTRQRSERLVQTTAAAATIVCWLPLAVLSILGGVAWGNGVTIPFFYDIAAHARFLVAVPMMIMAESIIGPRLDMVAAHFMKSGRIAATDRQAYFDAVDEGARLRDSKWAEVAVVFLAYLSTIAGRLIFAPTVSNWGWRVSDAGVQYLPAAFWYAMISIPIFQFLLFRWFLRMLMWARFLYRISKLKLKLQPTHPDRAGGIAFIGANQRYFAIIVFAVGAVVGGVYANEVMYEGLPIESIYAPSLTFALFFVLIVELPCLFFFPMLRRTKIRGMFEYGDLALKYTSDFDSKWIRGKNPDHEQVLGTGDIQSLADLGNSYSIIGEMKLVPLTLRSTLWLGAAFIIPILPVFLTVMPLADILATLLKLLA